MVHVLIEGNVQGIGFRQFIKYKAKKLNVKGWIKNLSDGRVEAVFAGNRLDIEKMLEFSRKGPFLAEVKGLEIEKLPDQEFDSFDIIKE